MTVDLPMEDWNKILSILAQAPWGQVNNVIMAMGEQLRAQPQAQPPVMNDPARPRPNGADTAP